MTSPLPAGKLEAPTRYRYGVLGFVCVLSMITYLDRVCLSTGQSSIMESLGIQSEADFQLTYFSFILAYSLFEIPTGWLGDTYGPRATLLRIVVWWSFFMVLTALVGMTIAGVALGGLTTMVVVRFFFGIGEAGAYPNITRALHNWFPVTERGLAQGTVWMTGRLMGGLTPFVWIGLVRYLGLNWRWSLGLFGIAGVVWCVAFAVWFRNRPEEKPEVNQAERDLIHAGSPPTSHSHAGVPWRRLFGSGNLWALCAIYALVTYGWTFHMSLLPKYLERRFGIGEVDWFGAVVKGSPLYIGAVACLLGGWLTDHYIRRTGDRKTGRRLFGIYGHGMAALCWAACLATPNAWTFGLAIAATGFGNDLAMGATWACCQDIGKRYAAIVAGCMNTIGNFGGVIAALTTKWIMDAYLAAHASQIGVLLDDLKAEKYRVREWVENYHPGQPVADGSFVAYALQQRVPIDTDSLLALQKHEVAIGSLSSYDLMFITFAAAYLLAVFLWFRVDATRPIVQEE